MGSKQPVKPLNKIRRMGYVIIAVSYGTASVLIALIPGLSPCQRLIIALAAGVSLAIYQEV